MTESGKKPLKILQLASQPGLFYCFLRPLVFELMRRGIEVHVACNRGHWHYRELAKAGMHMRPLTLGPWSKAATWRRLGSEMRRLMASLAYDLCVVHTPAISWLARREAARARIPAVAYTAHGLPFFERQGWLTFLMMLAVEKHCARYTDLILLVNSVDAAAARRHKLVKLGGIIRHIPGPGIDVPRWHHLHGPDRLATLRRELALADTTRTILFVGRLMKSKGVLDLVEVVARLRAAGRDIALLVAGQGPLENAVRRLAERRGVTSCVQLLGWRDDVVALTHLADLLALPSTYREGLPTVLMEAGAAAKPVVAYRNRGSDDVIEHGRTGYSVPAGDVDELTCAIGRLVDDPELARRMGEAGYERISTTFGFAQGVRAQLDAYADILEFKGIDAASLRGELGEPLFAMASGGEDGT
jgi:glycosyltransferase involved in cell wall biosynthesis